MSFKSNIIMRVAVNESARFQGEHWYCATWLSIVGLLITCFYCLFIDAAAYSLVCSKASGPLETMRDTCFSEVLALSSSSKLLSTIMPQRLTKVTRRWSVAYTSGARVERIWHAPTKRRASYHTYSVWIELERPRSLNVNQAEALETEMSNQGWFSRSLLFREFGRGEEIEANALAKSINDFISKLRKLQSSNDTSDVNKLLDFEYIVEISWFDEFILTICIIVTLCICKWGTLYNRLIFDAATHTAQLMSTSPLGAAVYLKVFRLSDVQLSIEDSRDSKGKPLYAPILVVQDRDHSSEHIKLAEPTSSLLTLQLFIRQGNEWLDSHARHQVDRPAVNDAGGDAVERPSNGATCSICLDRASNVLLRPCRHVCACRVCAPSLSTCPICRAFIVDRETVFIG